MTRLTAEDVERKSARNRAARKPRHADAMRESFAAAFNAKPTKPTKYRAVRTTVIKPDGTKITFASKKESHRYHYLSARLLSGSISDLKLQPVIKCAMNGVHICDYRADFLYFDREKQTMVWEDVKGFKTPIYRLKKKIVLALTGIEITET